MPLPHMSEETIVAPATPTGSGAIAIVRISGIRTQTLLSNCFQPIHKNSSVNNFPPRELILGEFKASHDGESIDQVLAVYMPGPRSYTGEDMAEIHCHGSPAVVAQIIDVLVGLGARPAEPGEFTRRAFENGRIDLAQAEAVCDLIRSTTASAGRMAMRQLAGGLSERVARLRQRLIEFAAEVEARLDFPEEEINPADDKSLGDLLQRSEDVLADLLRQGRRGRIVREGIRIVLIGRPNVGKSSLLNSLLGHERALVSPHPGTTRDTIESTIDLRGIAATLVDTAGWRSACDEIERMGVERTENEMASADFLLWVIDGNELPTEEDHAIARRISTLPVIVVCNKSDLPSRMTSDRIKTLGYEEEQICRISALLGKGIEDLESRIVSRLLGDENTAVMDETPLVSNARHLALLERAASGVAEARKAFVRGASGDLVMVDVRVALGALDEITGRQFGEEMLDVIFSRFCIGK